MDFQKRQTAYRFWIADLLQAKIALLQGGTAQIEVRDQPVARVTLIATVVHRFDTPDRSYRALSLDDGSGTIRLKAWREDTRLLDEGSVGELVLVVGRLRFYNEEFYLTPEVVRTLKDHHWDLVWRLALTKKYGKPQVSEARPLHMAVPQGTSSLSAEPAQVVQEEVVAPEPSESARQRILGLIERKSGERGADLNAVLTESGLPEAEAESAIEELLKEGEIFSPRPGLLKLID